MVFDITQLKKIRKQIGLTQFQFAKESGISQSMIAKIEAGKLDPTYSKVKKIEKAIDSLTKKHEKTAKEIMNKSMITIKPTEKVSKVLKIMKNKAISQIPVLDKNKVIGMVSELSILSKDLNEIKTLTAEEIMESSPPIISQNAEIYIVKQLLKFYPLLLIEEKGKLFGIITKADLINSLS
jgi:predicted transcriptional regulator